MEVSVKITGTGLQFESKISLFQATQIMAFISRAEQANMPLDAGNSAPLTTTTEQEPHALNAETLDVQTTYESPHAAITKTRAKTNPQKIVALAYYLGATSSNQRLFSVDEILSLFKKAGQSTPKNINRDFREAVSAGYVFQEDKNSYRLLSSVDNVQSEGFKRIRKRTNTRTGGTDKKTKLVVRDQVKNMRITTSMDGYIDFFKIKARADQLLWTVEYAKSQGVDGINRVEVIDFIKKIGGQITSKNFTGSNGPNMKNGYLYIENGLLKLTPKGKAHLSKLNNNSGTK